MKPNEIKKFLRGVELFRDLSDTELDLFTGEIEVRQYKQKEMLFSENAPGQKFLYLIYDGEVELFKTTPYGEEKRLSFFGKSDFLGEGTMISDAPHSTNARTLMDTTVLCL